MLFNSLQYVLFLPLVILLHYSLPPRHRWALLVAASYYFYACWRVDFALLIVTSTVVDYVAGLWMGRARTQRTRRFALLTSLCVNLGLLGFFKYALFANDVLGSLEPGWNLFAGHGALQRFLMEVGVPVGISFYTFQTLSYTIDVYRRKREPERHLGYFALYVCFFPQLVAGPIERSTSLLPQLKNPQPFDSERAASGLRLILWGLIKKIVVADKLGAVVDMAYGDPGAASGSGLLVATYFFAIQIYCDFSGYSDIAIGTARILGVNLMENFRTPYFARSIREYWSRWHISLTTWFRDYLYFPLGGSRRALPRVMFNVAVVFLLSGLWHGAAWTFVVWGGLHGAFYIGSRLTGLALARAGIRPPWWDGSPVVGLLRMLTTFHLVVFAFAFFRSASIGEAWMILGRIFEDPFGTYAGVSPSAVRAGIRLSVLLVLLEALHARFGLGRRLLEKPAPLRWAVYYAALALLLFQGVFETHRFIYFNF